MQCSGMQILEMPYYASIISGTDYHLSHYLFFKRWILKEVIHLSVALKRAIVEIRVDKCDAGHYRMLIIA